MSDITTAALEHLAREVMGLDPMCECEDFTYSHGGGPTPWNVCDECGHNEAVWDNWDTPHDSGSFAGFSPHERIDHAWMLRDEFAKHAVSRIAFSDALVKVVADRIGQRDVCIRQVVMLMTAHDITMAALAATNYVEADNDGE